MAAPESEPQFSTIREAFCAYYRCRPEAFERKAFWKTLYPHALLLALPIWVFNRRFFHADLETIRQFGSCRNAVEFGAVMGDFSTANALERNIRRGRLRIRVSGTRVLAMYQRLSEYLEPSEAETIEEYVKNSNTTEAGSGKMGVRRTVAPGKESKSVVLRKLRQAHEEWVVGGEKSAVLARIGMTEAAFQEALSSHGGGSPELVWLREVLLQEQRVRQLEVENAHLAGIIASLRHELDVVQGRSGHGKPSQPAGKGVI